MYILVYNLSMSNSPKIVNIALIEDDVAISTMYTKAFERQAGYKVRVAGDGIEGLELLKTYHPDIILLDMMMPRMSGLEALERIRALPNGNKYKIITLTNMNDPETVAAIKQYNVLDHIVKATTTPGEIVKTIQAAVK